MSNLQEKPEAIKPCEEDCPKCGSNNITRRFIGKGTPLIAAKWESGKLPENYKLDENGRITYSTDVIRHDCNTCTYGWKTFLGE